MNPIGDEGALTPQVLRILNLQRLNPDGVTVTWDNLGGYDDVTWDNLGGYDDVIWHPRCCTISWGHVFLETLAGEDLQQYLLITECGDDMWVVSCTTLEDVRERVLFDLKQPHTFLPRDLYDLDAGTGVPFELEHRLLFPIH